MIHARDVDPVTLAYLERVSGKRGDAAVAAWMKFTGFEEIVKTVKETPFHKGRRVLEIRRLSPEARLARAYAKARAKAEESEEVAA